MYQGRTGETYVVIIFLHGHDPRDIIEGDGTEAEVGVIGDLADLVDEGVEVWSREAVDGGDEVSRGQAVLVGGGTAALCDVSWLFSCSFRWG
jgi:cysteine synthase